VNEIFDDPKLHKFLDEDGRCQFCGYPEKNHKLNEVIDPRGPGSIDHLEAMEGGQPNIIDYTNQEPLLFGAGENSSHDYPGKIVVNNEPERALHVNDFEVKKATIPGPAATGLGSVGHNTTEPTLPTGAPIEIRDHPGHGDNFNDKIKWNESKIELMDKKVDDYSKNVDKFEIDVDKLADSAGVEPEEELLLKQIKASTPKSEGIEIKDESQEDNSIKPEEQLLYKQILASTGQNQTSVSSTEAGFQTSTNSTLMHIDGEKSDTGDDRSRTGPEGNKPEDNNDATHYEGLSDTKLNVATAIEITPEITKQLYNVDGTIPELREGVEIKTKDDKAEMIEFTFDEAIDDIEPDFEHTSSFVGKVRYFPRSQQMAIILGDKNYDFCGIPQRVFDAFAGAPSKGAFFNREIKQQYTCSVGLSEALTIRKDRQHGEFDWIDDDAINEMIKYARSHGSGKFILGVLSGETITDHRIEGTEKYRRRWSNNELIQNIRTAKGKMIDINHLFPKTDMQSGGVYDSNWNFTTNKGEVIIWETDRDILDAIRDNVIGAISIHTGLPRKIETNCSDGECFLEPSGTILGEQDNIALAYVVTGKDGFRYNGQIIPAMPPGMQFTRLYLVE